MQLGSTAEKKKSSCYLTLLFWRPQSSFLGSDAESDDVGAGSAGLGGLGSGAGDDLGSDGIDSGLGEVEVGGVTDEEEVDRESFLT